MDGSSPQPVTPGGNTELNHDEPVSLRAPDSPAPAPVAAAAVATPTADLTPTPAPAEQPVVPVVAPLPAALPTPAPDDNPLHAPDTIPTSEHHPDFSWTGPEFIEHPKTPMWYVILGAGTVLAMAIAWLFTSGDIISIIVIASCALLFGFMAARHPRELAFAVDNHGINIGQRHYAWSTFRSFAIVDEGSYTSIDFIPLKRFAPALSIFYDPRHESEILGVLSDHLPFANHKRTWLDALMHQIHF